MSSITHQLKTVLAQLERGERTSGPQDQSRVLKELLDIGKRWPVKGPDDEKDLAERLVKQLVKFTDAQQQDLVVAHRPLQDRVRAKMVESTAALNKWLSEAQEVDKASAQKLIELLQGFEGSYWFRCYKQCPDLPAKAPFLVAVASAIRAVHGDKAPLRAQVASHPRVLSLVRHLGERLFVLPKHGNVLNTWHDGRLDRYNRTLWRAARRAADRLRDDLQVRLVSALRRATAPVQLAGGKAKPQLQLELRAWPMVGCPLAKSFLDFVAQRGSELGDLGSPSLGECPPHSLRPQTLRRLLARLEAFEVLDSDGNKGDQLGIVRLRWEAVAALAFKAVGTKPKAAAQAVTTSAGSKGAAPVPADPPKKPAGSASCIGDHPPKPASRTNGNAGNGSAAASAAAAAAPKLVHRKIDWKDAHGLMRIVRRGVRAGDEDWRQSWQQFCKQKRVPTELSQGGHSKDVLAEFIERNLSKLVKKEWAKDLMFKPAPGSEPPPPAAAAAAAADESDEDHSEQSVSAAAAAEAALRQAAGAAAVQGKSKAPSAATAVAAAAAAAAAAAGGTGGGAAAGARKRPGSRSRDASSSGSDSSHSKRRKRRRREKRKLGAMGYGDYFGRGQKDMHITPEVMMMNQMMGMSMMMNSPLAMMGMGAGMMAAPQLSMMQSAGGAKAKKDDKGKKEKPEEKAKKEVRDRERKPDAPSQGGAGTPAAAAAGTAGGAAGAGAGKPATKDGKLDWSKRKDAMIDADDL